MTPCAWQSKIAAFHDGETALATGAEEHLATCPACAEELALLRQISAGAQARQVPEIADAQFRVFMDGIRDGIEAQRAPSRGFWAWASLCAAGLVLTLGLAYIVTGGPQPVKAAPEIESYSTQLENATVNTYSDDSSTTIWVNMERSPDL